MGNHENVHGLYYPGVNPGVSLAWFTHGGEYRTKTLYVNIRLDSFKIQADFNFIGYNV